MEKAKAEKPKEEPKVYPYRVRFPDGTTASAATAAEAARLAQEWREGNK